MLRDIYVDGRTIKNKMDHLACFAGGMLALGSLYVDPPERSELLELGEELTHGCLVMYDITPTGLPPDHIEYNADKIWVPRHGRHSVLRPEVVESLFYLWRITGKPF